MTDKAPRTEAGRALLIYSAVDGLPDREAWTDRILAIEAEAATLTNAAPDAALLALREVAARAREVLGARYFAITSPSKGTATALTKACDRLLEALDALDTNAAQAADAIKSEIEKAERERFYAFLKEYGWTERGITAARALLEQKP